MSSKSNTYFVNFIRTNPFMTILTWFDFKYAQIYLNDIVIFQKSYQNSNKKKKTRENEKNANCLSFETWHMLYIN